LLSPSNKLVFNLIDDPLLFTENYGTEAGPVAQAAKQQAAIDNALNQWFPHFFLAPPLKYKKKYFAHHTLFYINHRRQRYRGHFLVLL
jgi:hypothetical protein